MNEQRQLTGAPVDYLAKLLADAGLEASTRRLLGDRRGRAPEKLRQSMIGKHPTDQVFGLFVLRDAPPTAIAAPINPLTSRQWARDDASRSAMIHAETYFGTEYFPSFALDLDQLLAIDGGSAGLPIYLGLLAWAADRTPRLPIFATGVVSPDRATIGGVMYLEEKVRAALADLGEQDGWVLVPAACALPPDLDDDRVRHIGNLEEARELAFGPEPLTRHPARFDLEARLREAEHASSPQRVLDALDELRADCHFPEDRFRVDLLRGMQLRHLGRSHEAAQVHEDALHQARGVLRATALERMEVEHYNSRLDLFDELEPVAAFFAERTRRPFLETSTELYAGGIYSRALGMLGHFEQGLVERERVMPLHERSASLAAEAGQSYAELLLLHALAGRRDGLDAVVLGLQRATNASADQANQRLHNLSALLRAALAFGEVGAALRWVRGDGLLFGVEPLVEAAFLGGTGPISAHPQVTIARTYARLLRRDARTDEAIDLLGRLPEGSGLVGWLIEAGRLEQALAMRARGDAEGDTTRERALARMEELHAGATRHYFPEAGAPWSDVEHAIDSIWY